MNSLTIQSDILISKSYVNFICILLPVEHVFVLKWVLVDQVIMWRELVDTLIDPPIPLSYASSWKNICSVLLLGVWLVELLWYLKPTWQEKE